MKQFDAAGFEDVVQGGTAFGEVAGGEVKLGSGGFEGTGGFDADAGGAAGDEDDFVRPGVEEVAVLDDLDGGGAVVSRTCEFRGVVKGGVAGEFGV